MTVRVVLHYPYSGDYNAMAARTAVTNAASIALKGPRVIRRTIRLISVFWGRG
ncbi:hypothetical protein KCP78_16415 [Salmonella enterica subsp. enterica]|nr:hypothetical protein KCP78_16415 [Salmonella enterica subsp. enterica]